jgi:hypothetical protein
MKIDTRLNIYLKNIFYSFNYLILILIINYIISEDPSKEIELVQLFHQGKISFASMKIQLYPWNCFFNIFLLYLFFFYTVIIRYFLIFILMENFSLSVVFDVCCMSFLKGWKYIYALPLLFMILSLLDYSWVVMFWIKGFLFATIILKILRIERLYFENQISISIPYPKKTLGFISFSPLISLFFMIGFIK